MQVIKKLFLSVDLHLKPIIIFLFLLLFISMILETLSIGLIIPTIASVLNSSEINIYFKELNNFFYDKFNIDNLVLVSILILFIVYVFKIIFLIIVSWYQNYIIYKIRSHYNLKLYKIYLNQNLLFHLKKNSSEIIRNIINEVETFTYTFQVVFILLNEILIVIGIGALMVYLEPEATLTIFSVIFISSIIFYLFTQKIVFSWGKIRQYYEGLRIKEIQQSFGGIKEVKLSNKEKYFSQIFKKYSYKNFKAVQYQSFVSTLPRLWFEFIIIVSFIILFFMIYNKNSNTTSIITTLAVFGAASFRLLPSASRILNAAQDLRYLKPVVDLIHKELSLKYTDKNKIIQNIDFQNLSIKNLSFSYVDRNSQVLNNASLEINRGEFVGILGKSGTGKSTLLNIILGLIQPAQIKYNLNNTLVDFENVYYENLFAYVPQNVFLIDDTIFNNIVFSNNENKIDLKKISQCIIDSQLQDFIETLPDKLDTKVGEKGVQLSGGQVQRIGIARALYNNPEIIVFDEATNSLDAHNEKEILRSLVKLKNRYTIIFVTHKLTTMSSCDKIYKVSNGTIAEIVND